MEERFKQEYLPVITLTMTEVGCIKYSLYQSQANPSIFMLYEKLMSQEILERHLKMPYIQALSEKAREFLPEPVEINLWERIS